MQGDPKVLDSLNALLTEELSAIDQYVVQSHMFDDWGYTKLHERIAHEAEDERGHVSKLVHRILFLGGTPDVASRSPLKIGGDPKSMLENDLAYEVAVARRLNEAIALCRDAGDNGTRDMLDELLKDTEEDHIFWLESQLHLIAELGIENYLAQQL